MRATPPPADVIDARLQEQLILCEYAIADLTTAGANVFYAVGARDAMHPACTLQVFAQGARRFVCDERALTYAVRADGTPADAPGVRATLATRLANAREAANDGSVFRLVDDFPEIQRLKTDVFRERVDIEPRLKEKLAAARIRGLDAVRAIGDELAGAAGGLRGAAASVVVDLYLSYRAVEGWDEMIALVPQMAPPLAR